MKYWFKLCWQWRYHHLCALIPFGTINNTWTTSCGTAFAGCLQSFFTLLNISLPLSKFWHYIHKYYVVSAKITNPNTGPNCFVWILSPDFSHSHSVTAGQCGYTICVTLCFIDAWILKMTEKKVEITHLIIGRHCR